MGLPPPLKEGLLKTRNSGCEHGTEALCLESLGRWLPAHGLNFVKSLVSVLSPALWANPPSMQPTGNQPTKQPTRRQMPKVHKVQVGRQTVSPLDIQQVQI